MYFLLGISILLATMLVVNSLTSLLVTLLWKVLSAPAERWPAANRANLLCALRILPVSIGVASVALLFGPAYLTHEPRTNHEDVGAKLAMVAFISAIGIGIAIIRGIVTWRVTARLTADWLKKSKEVGLPGIRVPSYRMEHQFPVIAVVGILRPRVFIASQIFQSLSKKELSAALEHEAGHILARDNLKRGLMRVCRDTLLLIPCGRLLDSAWKEASEAAADEHAARRGSSAALDLASALVKIARMIPDGAKPGMPAAAALLVGHGHTEAGSVAHRVRRLSQYADATSCPSRSSSLPGVPVGIAFGLMILMIGLTMNEPYLLAVIHSQIEQGVRILD